MALNPEGSAARKLEAPKSEEAKKAPDLRVVGDDVEKTVAREAVPAEVQIEETDPDSLVKTAAKPEAGEATVSEAEGRRQMESQESIRAGIAEVQAQIVKNIKRLEAGDLPGGTTEQAKDLAAQAENAPSQAELELAKEEAEAYRASRTSMGERMQLPGEGTPALDAAMNEKSFAFETGKRAEKEARLDSALEGIENRSELDLEDDYDELANEIDTLREAMTNAEKAGDESKRIELMDDLERTITEMQAIQTELIKRDNESDKANVAAEAEAIESSDEMVAWDRYYDDMESGYLTDLENHDYSGYDADTLDSVLDDIYKQVEDIDGYLKNGSKKNEATVKKVRQMKDRFMKLQQEISKLTVEADVAPAVRSEAGEMASVADSVMESIGAEAEATEVDQESWGQYFDRIDSYIDTMKKERLTAYNDESIQTILSDVAEQIAGYDDYLRFESLSQDDSNRARVGRRELVAIQQRAEKILDDRRDRESFERPLEDVAVEGEGRAEKKSDTREVVQDLESKYLSGFETPEAQERAQELALEIRNLQQEAERLRDPNERKAGDIARYRARKKKLLEEARRVMNEQSQADLAA